MICDASDGYSIYGYAFQRGNRKIDYGQFDTNTNIFSACAGAALYRKNLFDKIGFFDEDFFAYLEDIDIGFRTLLNGEKCEYVPSAIIYHIDGGTSKKLNNFAAYYSYRNNLYLLAKNMPFCLLILFFPFIFSYQIRNLLISIKERNFKIFTKSYKDFFINFPEIFNKRKLIQKNKKISNYALYKILSKKYPFQIIKTCFNLTKKIIKYLLKLFFKIEFSEKKILYGKSSNSNSKL